MTSSRCGDSERQAFLRDKAIKEAKVVYEGPDANSTYIERITAKVKPGDTVVDVGCGTAHIIAELARWTSNVDYVGLDISPAMVRAARNNCKRVENVCIVQGDGLNMPFRSESFDMVLNRLAACSMSDIHRVLKSGGVFYQFGLGPQNHIELLNLFPDRYEKDAFFVPETPERWRSEVIDEKRGCGFSDVRLSDFKGLAYYPSVEDIMDLIEMVPLVKEFDREKDRGKLEESSRCRGDRKRIPLTYHYTIVEMRKT